MVPATRHFEAIVKFVFRVAIICSLTAPSVFWFPESACAQQNLLAKGDVEPADDLKRLPSDRKILQQLEELLHVLGENVEVAICNPYSVLLGAKFC